jgi:hypothetical protein
MSTPDAMSAFLRSPWWYGAPLRRAAGNLDTVKMVRYERVVRQVLEAQ